MNTTLPGSRENPRLLASIDIGTNSAILLIADREPSDRAQADRASTGGLSADREPGRGPGRGPLRPVLQRVAAPRVGRNLAATGRISEESFQALMAALEGFLGEIRASGARLAGAVATEAFRKASNGPALLGEVSALLGVPCRILTGEEEARLGWLAVHDRHPLEGLAVLDIGAGSTELTSRQGGVSLPIGAVALLEACGMGRLSVAAPCREMALAAFRENLGGMAPPAGGLGPAGGFALPEHLVVVGGTATAVAMLKLGLKAFDSAAIEGVELTLSEVDRIIDTLDRMPTAARATVPGLDQGRAEIIIPGLSILAAFLEFSGRQSFKVSDRGIRYGIILASEREPPGGIGHP